MDVTDVSFEVRPPKPTSLSISPSNVTAGAGSYTMTVGNGQDLTLDVQYKFNNVLQDPILSWPTQNSSGQSTHDVPHCYAPGTYEFTAIKNHADAGDSAAWLSPISASVTIASNAFVSSVSPTTAARGYSGTLTITGRNLCAVTLSPTLQGQAWSGVTLSNVQSNGSSVTATLTVAANASVGAGSIVISATYGQTALAFTVTSPDSNLSPPTPAKEYIYLGGKLLAVESGLGTSPSGSPSAPTAVSAAAQTSSTININWTDTSATENAFKLYWNTDGSGTYNGPISLAGNSSSYAHSGLTAGTTYYYRLSASNAFGDSALSPLSPVWATTLAGSGLNPPTGLSATATNVPALKVDLTWSSGGGAVAHYQIERSSNNGAFQSIGTSTTTTYTDQASVSNGITYLYRVRAVDAGGTPSAPSSIDPATTVFFTDPVLIAGQTVAKALHVTELRTAVDAVRASAGLAASSWTDATLTNQVFIKAVHIQQLRDRLAEALTALALSAPSYTDPVLTPAATTIKKAHIEELRGRVQ